MRASRALFGGLLLLGVLGWWMASDARDEEDAAEGPRAAPWALAASPDGTVLYVACGGRGEVAVVDARAHVVLRTLPVPGTPRGLAVAPDGVHLAVTLGPEDAAVLLDVGSGEVVRRLAPGLAPEGVAFTHEGHHLWIANRISMDVVAFDVATGERLARVDAGREPFALVVSPDGRTVAAVSRRAALAPPDDVPRSVVTLIDAERGEARARIHLPSFHLAEAACFLPDGSRLLVPGIRVRNLLPILQVARGWTLSSGLAVIDVESGAVSILPLQDVDHGFADPTGVAVGDGGGSAWIVGGGADELMGIDVARLLQVEEGGRPERPEDFTLRARYERVCVPAGDNPRGVALLGTGGEALVAVSERLDDTVAFFRGDGQLVARVEVGPRGDDDALRRGERAFYDARYCFQQVFSCTSCHPEAGTDGLTYDFDIDGVGRNVVLNRSLEGLKGTGPFKWTGVNATLQRQCGARFSMVLTRADLIPPDTLDDMAAWLESLPPPRSLRSADPTLDLEEDAVQRGRVVFERSLDNEGRRLSPFQRCITCHPPPEYSNRQRTDVGTRGPFDDTGAFDVPHLRGIGPKAPYLHDGRALTLRKIFEGSRDRHGFTSDLTPEQLADLVAYLESL